MDDLRANDAEDFRAKARIVSTVVADARRMASATDDRRLRENNTILKHCY